MRPVFSARAWEANRSSRDRTLHKAVAGQLSKHSEPLSNMCYPIPFPSSVQDRPLLSGQTLRLVAR